MRIGRDHIASTVYTIVFAYAGAALPILLLINLSGLPIGTHPDQRGARGGGRAHLCRLDRAGALGAVDDSRRCRPRALRQRLLTAPPGLRRGGRSVDGGRLERSGRGVPVTRAGTGPRAGADAGAIPVSTRNARFQQWAALLTNRTQAHAQRPVPHPRRAADHAGGRARLADRLDPARRAEAAFALGGRCPRRRPGAAVRPRRRVAARAGRQGRRDARAGRRRSPAARRPRSRRPRWQRAAARRVRPARPVPATWERSSAVPTRSARGAWSSRATPPTSTTRARCEPAPDRCSPCPSCTFPAAADVLAWLGAQRGDLRIVGTDETGTTPAATARTCAGRPLSWSATRPAA